MAERTAVSTASRSVRPLRWRSANTRPSSVVTSRATSAWIVRAVFFLRRQRILDRTQSTDLFADLDELTAEFLKTMKRRNLLLCLAEERRGRERLRDGLAPGFTSQAKVWTVAGIVAFGAMTARLSTLARCGGNGASTEIAQSSQLAEPVRSFSFQLLQGFDHKGTSYS